jgi:phage terminase large subunit GpA-like protein
MTEEAIYTEPAIEGDCFADIDAVVARAMRAWKPPPKLSLSQWADEFFYLSAETAAEPGKWKTLPYQRGIMDAMTDPAVEQVSVMKSARVGYTLMLSAAIGYWMHQDPSSMLLVQPTVDDAKNFSKETIAPMLRDVPVLSQIVFKDIEERGPKNASATLTHKAFPGGVLSLVGANSGSGLRRVSRRIVGFDEVDAYPASAGNDGDPIRLGIMRTQAFWNRKIIAGSTPLLAGASRIAELFEAGDQRRYHVPCPHCGHRDFLTFREGERGHWMAWPEGHPEEAHFVCRGNGCVIEHKYKREMISAGEWIADAEFRGHASFHIWAAYSYSPNATWAHIAREFIEANRGGPEQLKTFVNTVLGETWQERGEAPDWLRLYHRREQYEVATVPAGVHFLTAGVDVQRDRLVFEVVGWCDDRQSYSVDAGVIPGDTAGPDPWLRLDDLLARQWPCANGGTRTISMLAVDSGDQTQTVYNWARRYPMNRVIAVKGNAAARSIIGAPSSVDVNVRGKRMARGYKVWTVGVGIAKSELYGWLRLEKPTDGADYPPGYCHFPEYGEDFFKQLTAEHLVEIRKRTGFVAHEWQIMQGRENHFLDCRVYARAAAALMGLDRLAASRRAKTAPASAPAQQAQATQQATPPLQQSRPKPQPRRRQSGGWLNGGSGSGWLRKRR